MRTIKDPRKKPEGRRRTDLDEVEDSPPTKCTPPKKRKVSRSNKDDSLNDSGSTIGDIINQSDILSERSSTLEEDTSDLSSLKSTPPKKRNYQKLLKSVELNGETHNNEVTDSCDFDNKKGRGKKTTKKSEEKKIKIDNIVIEELDEEPGASSVKTSAKNALSRNKKNIANKTCDKSDINPLSSADLDSLDHLEDQISTVTKVRNSREAKKNLKALSKIKDTGNDTKESKQTLVNKKKKAINLKNKESPKKDKTKDHIDNAEVDDHDEEKANSDKHALPKAAETSNTVEADDENDIVEDTIPKSKKRRKTKKQIEKEEKEKAEQELKRQTEELRSLNAEKSKTREVRDNEKCTPDKPDRKNKSRKKRTPKAKNMKGNITNKSIEPVSSPSIPSHKKQDDVSTSLVQSSDKTDKDGGKHNSFDSQSSVDVKHDLKDCSIEDSKPISSEQLNEKINFDDIDNLDTSFESIESEARTETDFLDNKDALDQVDNSDAVVTKTMNISDLNAELKIEIRCQFCGSISRSKGGHTRHLRKCQQQNGEPDGDAPKTSKLHHCENCSFSAPRRVIVITHMKSHGIFQCKRCKFRTDAEENLEEHLAIEHKDRSDCRFCKNCNRYVKCNEIPLEKHMVECQGRIPFSCPECFKEFQYESSLKCHVVSHYPDKPKLFSCSLCDYKSNYKANLKKHIRHIHEQNKERNIKCPECDKLFFSDDNMKRHLKLHSEDRPYRCEEPDCDKGFKTENGLKFHLISHKTDKPFVCDLEECAADFKTKKALSMHMNTDHQNITKDFACPVEDCQFAFYKKEHLDQHLVAHSENFSFFCHWIGCIKAFRSSDSLKTHILQHTEDKPVKCQHCAYACRQKSTLRDHMKKNHPEFLENNLPDSGSLESVNNSLTMPVPDFSSSSLLALPPISASTPIKPEHTPGDNVVNQFQPAVQEPYVPQLHHIHRNDSLEEINKSTDKTEIPSVVNSLQTENNTNQILKSAEQLQKEDMVTETKPDVKELTKIPETEPVDDSDEAERNPGLHGERTDVTQETAVKPAQVTPAVDKRAHQTPLTGEKPDAPATGDKPTPCVSAMTEKPVPEKPKRTDMYDFQSEDDSGDEMKPGLLRKEFDRDKPILPPVNISVGDLTQDSTKEPSETKPQKVRKKPAPKRKPKPEKPENVQEVKEPKKRGRKRKSEVEKSENQSENPENNDTKKPKKRGRSPKGKREDPSANKDTDGEEDEKEIPVKKKRGRKPKEKDKDQNETSEPKVPKKRGRKPKAKTDIVDDSDKPKTVDPDDVDATINYSEVEGFADSKDGISDHADNLDLGICRKSIVNSDVDKSIENEKEKEEEQENDKVINNSEDTCANNEDEPVNKTEKVEVTDKEVTDKEVTDKDSDAYSDKSSSDLDTDYEMDFKPPPAPRPPPMYDSEDGDIESGPEFEDFNNPAMSNEPLRDFESSRENISREISRDFESSRENIDDSVPPNSAEASTPREHIDTPGSVNPASVNPSSVNPSSVNPASVNPASANPTSVHRLDSVGKDIDSHEHDESGTPHPSHHSSVPHTPTHSSIPTTPAARDFESFPIDHPDPVESRIKVQTNDENTDESSMPEVDKDYVGRFFEEINSTPAQDEEPVDSKNSIDDTNNKSQDKLEDTSHGDSGVPSLASSQTESTLQIKSPPTDLSLKRLDILPSERSHDEPYQPRAEAATRPPERIPSVPTYEQFNPLDPYTSPIPRDSVLRQTDPTKGPSPSIMRLPESQRMPTPYDRNIQNLHRITESVMPQHSTASPLLHHVPGREEVFPGAAGVTGSMSRNPFHPSWSGQDVRPPHWGHPTYLQRPLEQQTGSSSSLFGKDSYLPARDFMFDPSARAAAERNMFPSLPPPSHTQRPDIPHDTFQFDRFDLGSYFSHGLNASPSLPVDYTRAAHSSTQKTLEERYRQSSSGVSEFRPLPQTSTADVFSMNMMDKFYPRESMYHSQHIADNANPSFLPGVPTQHSMFAREYPRSFYAQNTPYSLDKNYAAAASAAKLGPTSVPPQRELVPVPRPNMSTPDSAQLQDPYRHHHSTMLYNMMNRYFD